MDGRTLFEPSDLERSIEETVLMMERCEVRFERGEPRGFFTKIAHRLSAGFTLPIVPRERGAALLLLKNLLAAWNCIVDDEIDREGKKGHLDASVQVLLDRSLGRPADARGSSAAHILDQIVRALPQGRPQFRDAFFFDLREMCNGFYYEHDINRWRSTANAPEYGKHSTATISIKPYLDLDCLFAAAEPPPSTYARLRRGYDHLSLAFKYASDIGSLERELVDEDNLNLIRILATEAGVELDTNAPGESSGARRCLVERVRRMAEASLSDARRDLAGVTSPDTSAVLRAACAFVEGYVGGVDPFFEGRPEAAAR